MQLSSMKKRRPRGAFFIYALSNLGTAEVAMKLDNFKDQNYFSVRKCEKEKEVNKYGMGTNQYQSF